jgi:hypothetical protein
LPAADPPLDAAGGALSWLVDNVSSASSDAGVPDAGAISPSDPIAGGPPGYLSQPVALDPGTYVLSWWDQARGLDGTLANPSTEPYRASVFDAAWSSLAEFSGPAQPPGTPAWSGLRALQFTVTTSGVEHVAIAPSSPGARRGSVAIAGVQLERSGNGNPTAYQVTEGTLNTRSPLCPAPSAAALRGAFQRNCDSTGACFFELSAPFEIDTLALQSGAAFAGRFAKGNYNYRHVTSAINLVGTGVHACPTSNSQQCFGSAFVEYTLQHAADEVPILDWSGLAHYFSFGTGRVEHGKALAAERFITIPVGSADQQLLTQPGITHQELRGRPLDGAYRFRIWDSPSLQWDHLDDIQVVLQYHYWSRVDRQPGSN